MIRNYFRVIYITIEKIIIGNTQPTHEVLWRSPDGPLKVLTSGTYKGPSGGSLETNTKIHDFMKKLFFRSNSQIFKSSKQGRPWDVYGTHLRDVHGTKWWDVLRMSVGRRSNMLLN